MLQYVWMSWKKNWKWEVINWFLWPRRKYVELLGGKISETDVRSFFFVRLSSCKVDSYVFYAFFIAIYWNYNLMELIERQFHRCIQKNRRNEMTSEKKIVRHSDNRWFMLIIITHEIQLFASWCLRWTVISFSSLILWENERVFIETCSRLRWPYDSHDFWY